MGNCIKGSQHQGGWKPLLWSQSPLASLSDETLGMIHACQFTFIRSVLTLWGIHPVTGNPAGKSATRPETRSFLQFGTEPLYF